MPRKPAEPQKPAARKRAIEKYEHGDKERINNPQVGLLTPQTDPLVGSRRTYQYDPHLDPQLVWAGKAEHTSFEVPTVSLHVHERIDPRTIIEAVRKRNGDGTPVQGSLFAHDQKRDVTAGRVGLTVGNFAAGWFTRFRFTPMSATQAAALIVSPPRKIEPGPPGTVMSWRVSDTFDEKSLATKYQLTAADQAARTWTPLAAEPNGLTNLARLQGIAEGKDTAFARITVTSDRDQVKKLRFGFSEHVKVYLNGTLLYGGQDDYASRDYRFLGTIGLFDELYLPLKKGENEAWFAVTETFGGWGIIARFEDPTGISWR